MTVENGQSTRDLYRAAFAPAAESEPDRDRAPSAPRLSRLVRTADVLTLVLGLWLIAAPYALNYTGVGGLDGFWNDGVMGAVVSLAALLRLAAPLRAFTVRIASLLAGIWLILAPAILGYVGGAAPKATANEIAVGALVAVLALVSLLGAASAAESDGDRDRRPDAPVS